MFSLADSLWNPPNWRMCRPKRQSGYFRRQTHITSDWYLNKIYITWRISTVQTCKTHDQHISRILKAHYTVTYVPSNFVFPLLCVSSADVDFWVNGGWDQPNCGVTFDVTQYLLLLLQNQNFSRKICEFFIIYPSKLLFQILKVVLIET